MVRHAVMVQLGRAAAQGRARRSPAITAPGSSRPPLLHAPSTWRAWRTGERPAVVLAAAAPAGGCEFRSAARAEKPRAAEGGQARAGDVS